MRPLISVAMPAYNAEKFIRAAIESVLRQKFQHFELIVIDDHSEDNTYQIVRELTGDARVRLYKNTRRMGETDTKNKILKLARGKYIAALDADDLMLQGRLKDHCEFLEKHPEIGAVFGRGFVATENLERVIILIPPTIRQDGKVLRGSCRAKELPYDFNQGMATIKKEHILKAGRFEASLPIGEDSRLMRRLFKITPFYFLNKPCFIYRIQKKGVCHSRLRENFKRMHDVFTAKKRQMPKIQYFYVNKQWLRVRTDCYKLMRAIRWRLNFYSWVKKQRKSNERIVRLDLKTPQKKAARVTDPELFACGFMNPLEQQLIKRNETFLEAALVSRGERGFLIVADEKVRSEAVLAFLSQDYCYYSANSPILYLKSKDVYGKSFVDPLVLYDSASGGGKKRNVWGRFWNPILKKYCINTFFYRTYLTGDVCRIEKVLFINFNPTFQRLRSRSLNASELYSRLVRDNYAKLYLRYAGRPDIFKKISLRAGGFSVSVGPNGMLKLAEMLKH